MNRRRFLTSAAALSSLGVAGCGATAGGPPQSAPQLAAAPVAAARPSPIPPAVAAAYGPRPNEQFALGAVDIARVPPQFWRQRVPFDAPYRPGTLLVDTRNFYLYFVEPMGRATRYGVGLGRAGFEWSGRGVIEWKRAWPTWTPPASMIARQPMLERWSAANGGMPPGLDNPLGARALYIYRNGVDTLYRVHGTPHYASIGTAASSGCVRMINQDVIDLYERITPGGAIVVV